jgi:hypothetical protein
MNSVVETIELTVLMPCLNEAETVAICVKKATAWMAQWRVNGEVLVADNGSTDGSQALATAAGARVVPVSIRGYGAALSAGINAARGRYVIMADADDSYDFSRMEQFLEKLREGYLLVMGNRFLGGIQPGAMPKLHFYLGNPVLSFIGRLFFRSPIGDFHCGLRGFDRQAILALQLQTTGMEFASEMVVKATLARLRTCEVPTTLSPDGRSRPPHLRSWRDGWRHLRFLLMYCPRWLFLLPGVTLCSMGAAITVWLMGGSRAIGAVVFDIHTLLAGSGFMIIGYQAVVFAILTKVFAIAEGLLPEDPQLTRISRYIRLEVGIIVGFALIVASLCGAGYSVWTWRKLGFGNLHASETMRTFIPAITAGVIGSQTVLASFYLSILQLRRGRPQLATVAA